MAASLGPARSTDHDPVVSVRVPSRGPYGLVLEDDGAGRAAVIVAWERLPDGKFGAVQRHGGVRVGDVLVGVSDTPTAEVDFAIVLQLLADESALKKTLHFCARAELERRRVATGVADAPMRASFSAQPRFVSRVRRARVTEGKSPVAEYEVVCALRLDATKVEHERVRKWAVWQRFSAFEKLHGAVQTSLGWRLGGAAFAPKHRLAYDKFAPDFLEARRAALDVWWQAAIAVDRAADFYAHHCDASLKAFVRAEEHLAAADGAAGDADAKAPQATARRKSAPSATQRRPAPLKSGLSRRGSGLGAAAGALVVSDAPAAAPPQATAAAARPPPPSEPRSPRTPPPPPPARKPAAVNAPPPPDARRSMLLSQISWFKSD
ncbi:hypothetical protein M885DRAFT_520361 [Pelagophyceae sp. CCMP2097]|nr:hypothetical protein M885DRAFT_520361 [Pelagophyceae sp. CCMP2097]